MWSFVACDADSEMAAALEHGLENGVFKSSLALHRRGEYHYLASGISFGGDKTVSCPDVR